MTLGRDTLKGYFKAGSLPSQDDFYGLIDSMLHMEDEGFRKTRNNGLEITSALGQTSLLTFFQKEKEGLARWTLKHGAASTLNLHPVPAEGKGRAGSALFTLHPGGLVGIGVEAPAHALHVNGFVAATGRVGTLRPPLTETLKADGLPHVLATNLSGCCAFEVVASASGAPSQGRYAVMHAIALNAHHPRLPGLWGYIDKWFNRKRRIRTHNAWFGERCDRIELSWRLVGEGKGKGKDAVVEPARGEGGRRNELYELVICTKCDYGEGARLEVSVTQLWPVPGVPRRDAVGAPPDAEPQFRAAANAGPAAAEMPAEPTAEKPVRPPLARANGKRVEPRA